MKRIFSLLLAMLMILSVITVASAEADGKLTIWTWDPTFNIAAMKVAKEMYQAEHPDVEIEIVEVLSDDIEKNVTTAAAAGDLSTLPDIMLCQDNSYQRMVTNYPEVYADITGRFDLSEFGAAKVAYSTLNGQNYGIPFDAGTCVAAYRLDYLTEAGYTVEDLTDITWSRFIEIGKDVYAKTGHPMLSGQADSTDMILIMLQSCGASMFDEDGAVNFTANDALKVVLETYNTMVQEKIFAEVNSWDEYIGTLSNGTATCAMTGCWILSTIISLPDQSGNWAVTNLPALDGVENATHYSNNGGSSWAITAGKDEDLALDFMKLYTNVDFYNTILPTTSAIATWAPAKEGSNYTAPQEFFGGDAVFAKIVDYTAQVPSNITGAFYYDARNALSTAKTRYLNGEGELDDLLGQAEDDVNFNMGF